MDIPPLFANSPSERRRPANTGLVLAPNFHKPQSPGSDSDVDSAFGGCRRGTRLSRSRLRTGCWTWRERKVKCDELRPKCGSCTRSDKDCNWSLRWRFYDLSVRTRRRHRYVCRVPVSGAEEKRNSEEQRKISEKAMEMPDCKHLRQDQEWQRDSLVAWAARKRQDIIDGYALLELQLLPYFDRQKDQLAEKQSAAIARTKDKHVLDEHVMRERHEVKTWNNAIALKHTEAYCRRESASGDRHDRIITDRDMAELTRARRARDQMEAKHSGATSVLRSD